MQAPKMHFMRNLYLKRFFEENQARSPLQKVISLQRKIDSSRSNAVRSSHKDEIYQKQSFLSEEKDQFRPATNMSYRKRVIREKNHPTVWKNINITQEQNGQENKPKSEKEAIKSFIIKGSPRKQNFFSNSKTSTMRQPQRFQFSHIKDTSNYPGLPLTQLSSQLRTLSEQRQRRVSHQTIPINSNKKQVSKKVYIGGQNLEQAAEQYSKNFHEINSQIQNYQNQQRKLLQTKMASRIKRRSTEKDSKKWRKMKNSNNIDQPKLKKIASKTQTKCKKDDLLNLGLDPWNVIEIDYQ